MQIKHELELMKQKQAARIIFNRHRLMHTHSLLKSLNALNVYQINLLQVLLFMYKIKTNTPPRIFAYHLQTINPKYATRYSRKISKRQRERETDSSYAKYFIHARGPVIWNSLLNETEKKHIIAAFL